MHRPLLALAIAAAIIFGFWRWMGAPVPMPQSPIAAGEKLHCVSYAPFRGQQNPLSSATFIDAKQIDDDLARLAKVAECVRTYSTEHGLYQVPEIAAKHGLKVLQGLWLSSSPKKNQTQFDEVVALAKQHPQTIRGIVVGNEVLLRGEMSAIDLAATIRRVKAAVSMPVTYADVWEFWARNRDLAAAVDFITIHILPYWEDFPVGADKAAAHVDQIRNEVGQIFPGREILIGETGWPSAGRMREGALPSLSHEAKVLHETLAVAKRGNYKVNVIEAFDQPWKRALEGTVGGHWGLYDADTREAKFVWGEPVSDHPRWKLQAAGGVAFAALIVLAAFWGRQIDTNARWGGTALIATFAGASIGLAIENAPVESLGLGGWVRTLAMLFVALTLPVLGAIGVMRGYSVPAFERVIGDARDAGKIRLIIGALAIALTVLVVQVTAGLVFDPRYKDFPNPALIGAVVAVLMVILMARQPREGGFAERFIGFTLIASAIYIAFNEGFANWQSLVFVALLLAMSVSLLLSAGVRKRA
ncbi:hypothetical protein GJW-30_1_03195 [Variibacter gotjawalensis]|uniref:Endo-1,3-beta-glucanase btgC n=1 Tax=Variibacter gotjawalensis TaxID=1333996 RepID=A0A0S3PXJ5_9BRAD|nr:beta-1,6-glucan synthase [Variibacter gotjawalensis]NIK46479.1 glucan 1,3-beta-glucosidase [Variibacter gotjawalensis]RZS48388.1 glucan 1,3-beta-glucosidase [Variibacter gotjawalensis]BAT60647.1 hypothetical protein GJW-30_1_03195 [Variibacter gotjawalensis]